MLWARDLYGHRSHHAPAPPLPHHEQPSGCLHVAPKIRRGYEDAIRLYLPNYFRRRPLRSLSPSDLQDVIGDPVDRGLSPSTIHGSRTVIRLILNRAIKSEFIDRNPARVLDLPKRRKFAEG